MSSCGNAQQTCVGTRRFYYSQYRAAQQAVNLSENGPDPRFPIQKTRDGIRVNSGNFISQCLFAGNFPMTNDPKAANPNDPNLNSDRGWRADYDQSGKDIVGNNVWRNHDLVGGHEKVVLGTN
jgi:hypothetical protein